MSDEPQPLRLKPRLKVDPAATVEPKAETSAAPVVEPAPAAPAPPPASATPEPPPAVDKPRLKPRLAPTAEPASRPPMPPPSATRSPIPVPPPAPVAEEPQSEVVPPLAATAPSAESGKFKLKPKLPAPAPDTLPVVAAAPIPEPLPEVIGSNPPMASAPAPAESAPAEGAFAAEPAAADPALAPVEDGAPAAPKLKIRPPGPITSEPPGAPISLLAGTTKRSGKKRLILLVAGVVVLAAWQILFKEEPPPPPIVRKAPAPKTDTPVAPKTAAAPGTTPTPAGPAPATSTAGKAVEKAKAVVAGRTGDGKAAAPDMIEDRAPAAPNLAAPPVQGGSAPASAEVKVAAGITATTKGVDATADASPAFKSWAVNAKISSVRAGGNNPAAFINGRLISRGGIVDDALGVVLDAIDADKKVLTFRDKTGATVSRPYF